MFGIKIIKVSEYNNLIQCAQRHYEAHKKECEAYAKMKKDCESLREQLNEKMVEVNKLHEKNKNYEREVKSLREFKRDTLEAMGQIDLAGFHLSICNKKCDHCDNEQHDCRKYEFGKHQYCVIPK
jgi:predicted RNase H-like nuclease (RuvC/YqgF family)